MIPLRPFLATVLILADGLPPFDGIPASAAAATLATATHAENGELAQLGGGFVFLAGLMLVVVVLGFRRTAIRHGVRAALENALRLVLVVPLTWLPLALLHVLTGLPSGWVTVPLWLVLVVVVMAIGGKLVPGPIRRVWAALFAAPATDTHGSAHFGTATIGAHHLASAAPADAFVLGVLRDAPRHTDRRFRHDGHILTCAPTGAGKGIGAVIPNLLDYPGSAFVLDFKGENYAVTARARRALGGGQEVILVDPFGITGAPAHALNWLDTLDPASPDVVSLAGGLADMLIVAEGAAADTHWNDTARELLRGLLIHVADLPGERRSKPSHLSACFLFDRPPAGGACVSGTASVRAAPVILVQHPAIGMHQAARSATPSFR